MKKLLIFLMLICAVVTASASASLVIDNADLLTVQQEQLLSQQFADIQQALDIDVVVLTESAIYGESPMDYADDYYDYNGYQYDGVLLLVDMDSRNWWISTSGSCIAPIDADLIGDQIVPLLSEGAYYEAFSLFGRLVQITLEYQGDIDGYNVDDYGNAQVVPHATHWYDGLVICMLIGIVAGGITVAVMSGGMKSVRAKGSAADYINRNSLVITRQDDRFLYQTVTRRAKPKSNSGSHIGSSGRSHGGGGGRF